MDDDTGLPFAYIPYYDIVMHTMRLRAAFYDLLPTRHGEDTP